VVEFGKIMNKTALIVWGGWDGHTPDRSAAVVRDILEAHDFDVRVESTTTAYLDPAIHNLSLIVPMITMSTTCVRLSKTASVSAGFTG
jgi:uncharacterized protein